MSSSSMARTNCRMAAKSIRVRNVLVAEALARPRFCRMAIPRGPRREGLGDESLAAVYSAADRHHALDDRRVARRLRRLPAIAGLRITAGRLPHDPGDHLL